MPPAILAYGRIVFSERSSGIVGHVVASEKGSKMRCRSLGWAGVEIEENGSTLVVDPLTNPGALYAAVRDAAAAVTLPRVVSPEAARSALAALVTHLHRDHADAGALVSALAPGATVLMPDGTGYVGSNAGLAQASSELQAAALTLRPVSPWESIEVGPFTVTALPAADGTGEPQLSWAISAGDRRVIHCGDTLFHGWWWRAAKAAGPFDAAFLPINGAVVDFPWRQPASPLPAVMTPEQAVHAARALGAATAVPMHFGGYDFEPYYRSIPDALARFRAAARAAGVGVTVLDAGECLELGG
jgi:L-ascorbate metabolism protein UlaG (beta-lactamase superfamily)